MAGRLKSIGAWPPSRNFSHSAAATAMKKGVTAFLPSAIFAVTVQ